MKASQSQMIGCLGFFFLAILAGCNQNNPPAPQPNKGLPKVPASSTSDFPNLSDDPQIQTMKNKVKKIEDGSGKMTEEEVITLLGPANQTTKENEGVIGKTWDNSSWIRIEFKDEKASDLSFHISPQTASKTINEDHFKKLKQGMTQGEINSILGFSPNKVNTTQEGNPRRTWRKANVITVYFKYGKVLSYSWEYPTARNG